MPTARCAGEADAALARACRDWTAANGGDDDDDDDDEHGRHRPRCFVLGDDSDFALFRGAAYASLASLRVDAAADNPPIADAGAVATASACVVRRAELAEVVRARQQDLPHTARP